MNEYIITNSISPIIMILLIIIVFKLNKIIKLLSNQNEKESSKKVNIDKEL